MGISGERRADVGGLDRWGQVCETGVRKQRAQIDDSRQRF
jgi:hypothetical protein